MRACLWLAVLGLRVPIVAEAQEVGAPDHTSAASLRRCVDYVGRGALRSIGKPKEIDTPPGEADGSSIVLGGALYRLRFRERAALVGQALHKPRTLIVAAHALRQIDMDDAVVFLDRERGLVDFEWVWKDSAGREFIPIFEWPVMEARYSWLPLAIRSFAREIGYSDPQPYWPNYEFDERDGPEMVVRHGDGWHVRYGLYLADIPALMAAARTEDCFG